MGGDRAQGNGHPCPSFLRPTPGAVHRFSSLARSRDGEDGRRGEEAPPNRLLPRGPVRAGRQGLGGGARRGDVGAGHDDDPQHVAESMLRVEMSYGRCGDAYPGFSPVPIVPLLTNGQMLLIPEDKMHKKITILIH